MRATDITREEVYGLLEEAKQLNKVSKKDREDHIKQRLKFKYSGLEDLTIVRNGHAYKVLDYIMDDLDSYGPLPES